MTTERTVLIIGGAAVAAYLVWRFAQTQSTAVGAAVVATGAYTPSGPPPGVPYPSAPPPIAASIANSLPPGVLAQYQQGLITSVVPAFVGVSPAQRQVLVAKGYRIVSGNAYPTAALATQPPQAANSGTVVAGGGLPPAVPVLAQ